MFRTYGLAIKCIITYAYDKRYFIILFKTIFVT